MNEFAKDACCQVVVELCTISREKNLPSVYCIITTLSRLLTFVFFCTSTKKSSWLYMACNCMHSSYCFAWQKIVSSFCIPYHCWKFWHVNFSRQCFSLRKTEALWRCRNVLDATFSARGHKLVSFIPSLFQLLFSVTPWVTSHVGRLTWCVLSFRIPKFFCPRLLFYFPLLLEKLVTALVILGVCS